MGMPADSADRAGGMGGADSAGAGGANGTGGAGRESQRAHDRVGVACAAEVFPVTEFGPGEGWPCETLDLSRGGVGLITKRMLYPGQRAVVAIRKAASPTVLFGAVRHVRYVPGRGHVVGLCFEAMPAKVADWCASRGLGGSVAKSA